MSYAINKIIFDYLQVNNDVMLEGDVLQALSELLSQKPQYEWSLVKWHEGTPLLKNVINQESEGVIADLQVVMDYIVSDTEKEAFQDENTFRKSQKDFSKFIQYAEVWHVLEFVSAMLGLLAMLILITICIFRARILESIILSSAVMEEYKFVNPTANPNSGVNAFTLPLLKNGELQKEFTFRPPTLPPNWEEMFVAHEKHVVFLNTIIMAILIALDFWLFYKQFLRNVDMYPHCRECASPYTQ